MYPALVWHVGHHVFTLSMWTSCVALGVLAGAGCAIRSARRPDVVLATIPLVMASALAGARGLAWWLTPVPDAGAGWSSIGGIAAGLAALGLAARGFGVRVGELLDAIAPAALVGFACGRLGCFLAGCCYGTPSTMPWAFALPALDAVPRHPTALYEVTGDLLAAVWAHRAVEGRRARRALLGYALVRTTIEGLRDAGSTTLLGGGPFTVPQVACAMLVVWAVWMQRSVDRSRAWTVCQGPWRV